MSSYIFTLEKAQPTTRMFCFNPCYLIFVEKRSLSCLPHVSLFLSSALSLRRSHTQRYALMKTLAHTQIHTKTHADVKQAHVITSVQRCYKMPDSVCISVYVFRVL